MTKVKKLPPAAPAMVPYKAPQMPPRRPGSDHSHIPSIAAGKEMPRRV